MEIWGKLSLQIRLFLVFIVIKLLPLLLLGWMAWSQSYQTAQDLTKQAEHLVEMADETIQHVGNTAIADAVAALNSRAREDIERQTTDTARDVADFLYGRDADIRFARTLQPSVTLYRNFIDNKRRDLTYHGEWKLAEDGKSWVPVIRQKKTVHQPNPAAGTMQKIFIIARLCRSNQGTCRSIWK